MTKYAKKSFRLNLILLILLLPLCIIDINLIVFPFLYLVYFVYSLVKKDNLILNFLSKKIKYTPYTEDYLSRKHIKSGDNEDVKKALDMLIELLKKQLWFPYQDGTTFIKSYVEKYANKKAIPKAKLLQMVEILCNKLKLDFNLLDFNLEKFDKKLKNPGGYFQVIAYAKCKIVVYISKDSNFYTITSSIIHELCHYFMYTNEIGDFNNLNDDEINIQTMELCTDILVVYLGFGEYLKKGYSNVRYHSGKVFTGGKDFSLGYLPCEYIDYVQQVIKKNRNNDS